MACSTYTPPGASRALMSRNTSPLKSGNDGESGSGSVRSLITTLVPLAVVLDERQRVADDHVARAGRRTHRPTIRAGSASASSTTSPSMSTIVQRATAGIAQHLAQRRALTAAEDQHLGRGRRRRHRRVHQRLVVDLLVGLRALRVAVEHQHLAEHRRAQHRDRLERRAPRVVGLLDRVRVELGRRELLDVPLVVLGLRHGARSGWAAARDALPAAAVRREKARCRRSGLRFSRGCRATRCGGR